MRRDSDSLFVTGGPDFHAAAKSGLRLGAGYDDKLVIPEDLIEQLRAGYIDCATL